MPNNLVVTPGYTFSNNELVTYTKLNQLGNPIVSAGSLSAPAQLNYLRNGNFYNQYWLNTAGISCPTSGGPTINAAMWGATPVGAACTYLQSALVPNTHSTDSAQITGATSVTSVLFSQDIPGELSVTLNGTISFSAWIFNNTGSNLTPTLQIYSANAFDNFSAVTSIATQALSTIPSGTWAQVSTSVNITGLSNIANGLRVGINFPGLGSSGQSVNISQVALVTGSTPLTSAFLDDFGFFPPTKSPVFVSNALGYMPLYSPQNNACINGNLDVWQEKTSYSIPIGIQNIPVADCWRSNSNLTGTTITVSQVTGVNVSPLDNFNPFLSNCLRVSNASAEASLPAGEFYTVNSPIEGYTAESMQGRPLSLQFWVRSSVTGLYSINIQNVNGTAIVAYTYTISAANTWQQVKIQNIPQLATGLGSGWNFGAGTGIKITFWLCSGGTTTATTGTWIAAGPQPVTGQVNFVSSATQTWDVTGVQLEPGVVCTPLNYISFPDQLLKAKRFFQKSYDYSVAAGTITNAGELFFTAPGTGFAVGGFEFPVEMSTAPTVTIYNSQTGVVNNLQEFPLNTNNRAVASSSSSTKGISFLTATSMTSGQSGRFHYIADSRLL